MIAGLIRNTPEEFIDFENVTFDLGSEFSVDGSDVEEWYPGAKTIVHKEGRYIINIPIVRKTSVYAYYSDEIEKSIEEARAVVTDLERTRDIYKSLGAGQTDGE